MIDIMKTVFVAADEYEMRYKKQPVLFINRPLYNKLMVDRDLRDSLCFGLDNMSLYGYPVKLVHDDSSEMHFWIGEQKPIYGKENRNV
jgi:hypothetical protein